MRFVVFFIAVSVTSIAVANDVTSTYRGTGVFRLQKPGSETESEPAAISVAPRSRPATPGVPLSGGEPRFDYTSARDRNAELFKIFKPFFEKCSNGCDAGRMTLYRPSNGSRTCHSTSQAIDLHGLICDGVTIDAATDRTGRFKQFVECIEGQTYRGDHSSYNGRSWKALYQQTHVHSSHHCHVAERRDETQCHWDHAHFSLGCMRNGRLFW